MAICPCIVSSSCPPIPTWPCAAPRPGAGGGPRTHALSRSAANCSQAHRQRQHCTPTVLCPRQSLGRGASQGALGLRIAGERGGSETLEEEETERPEKEEAGENSQPQLQQMEEAKWRRKVHPVSGISCLDKRSLFAHPHLYSFYSRPISQKATPHPPASRSTHAPPPCRILLGLPFPSEDKFLLSYTPDVILEAI